MQINYNEGDWFAAPLTRGYGIGLVARTQPARSGVLLGYFFGPRRHEVPALDDLVDLSPTDALLIRLFGHLEIRNGNWPVVGNTATWNRSVWPVPAFIRAPSIGPRVLVTRSDSDPSLITAERALDARDSEPAGAVPEGLLGAGLVVKLLEKAIAATEASNG